MATDVVSQLSRLVALRSVAGGDNRPLIAEIGETLQDAGARVTVRPGTRPDAQVLHGVLGPADAPGGVLLAAHGDVVDVAGQPWSSDPFTLCRRGDRLHGRGAADMKGFVAAVLAAVGAVDCSALVAPLHVAISHDEELGCAGTAPLLELLTDGRTVPAPLAGTIVGEPTELGVVRRHKGKAAFEITVRGRAAHSATPAAGVNAVIGAAHLIVALQALEGELVAELSDPAFSTPHATIGVGPISGGVAVNIVPDRCLLRVETRVLPGQRVEEVQARIEAVAARVEATLVDRASEAGVEVTRVAGYPPLSSEPDADAFAQRITRLTGRTGDGAVDFGTEAGLYQQHLGVPVLVCGPGSMTQGHVPDEYIAVDELAAAEAFVTRLLEQLSDRGRP